MKECPDLNIFSNRTKEDANTSKNTSFSSTLKYLRQRRWKGKFKFGFNYHPATMEKKLRLSASFDTRKSQYRTVGNAAKITVTMAKPITAK